MVKLFYILTLLCVCTVASFSQSIYNDRSSLVLNGQNQYADCGTSNRNITTEVTLEAWIKTSSAGSQWVAGKHDAANNQGYYLYAQNGKIAFGGSTSNAVTVSSGFSLTNINDSIWHHVAGVFRNGTWEIWIDGVMENSTVSGNITLISSVPFTLGRNSLTGTNFFEGNIAEVKIWNTARTASEIRTFMCKVIKNPVPELVGYFKCDPRNSAATPGTGLKDDSNYNLNGQLINYPLNGGFVQKGPPVGNESIFIYGNNLQNTSLKLNGWILDTITVNQITGQAKGIHIYRSDTPGNPLPLPLGLYNFGYFFGVYTAGDTTTTYHISQSRDSVNCAFNLFYLYKRFDSFSTFNKINPGPFNLITDQITETTDQYRGEYLFSGKWPDRRIFTDTTLVLCPGNSLTLTASAPTGRYFIWNTGDTSKTITVTQPGKYSVLIDDQCVSIGTDTFRVVLPPQVTISGNTTFCPGSYTVLTASHGNSFLWNNGAISQSISVSQPGNYSVAVTDSSGCLSSASVTVSYLPGTRIPISGNRFLCSTNTTTLTANTTLPIIWNTGQTSQSISVSQPGKYYVTPQNPVQCPLSDTVNVELVAPPEFSLGNDTILCYGQTLDFLLPKGYRYLWQDGSTSQNYTVSKPGTYTAQLTDTLCLQSQSRSIRVNYANCTPENVFFPNIITPNNDGLNDHFIIVGLPLSEYTLQIYNRWGVQVYQTDNYQNNWNGKEQSSGVYYYLLKHKRTTQPFKGYLEVVK